MNTKQIGLCIVILGTIITAIGVTFNNLALNHILAMQIWVLSNSLFAIYFYGHSKEWWDGKISDEIMCGLYLYMLVSGLYGLVVQ